MNPDTCPMCGQALWRPESWYTLCEECGYIRNHALSWVLTPSGRALALPGHVARRRAELGIAPGDVS